MTAYELEFAEAGIPANVRRLAQEILAAGDAQAHDPRAAVRQKRDPAVPVLDAARGASGEFARDTRQCPGTAGLPFVVHCRVTSTLTAVVPGVGSGTTSPSTATPSTVSETPLPGPARLTLIS